MRYAHWGHRRRDPRPARRSSDLLAAEQLAEALGHRGEGVRRVRGPLGATEVCGDDHLGARVEQPVEGGQRGPEDRKSTRLNSSHVANSYAVFCSNKKKGAPEIME